MSYIIWLICRLLTLIFFRDRGNLGPANKIHDPSFLVALATKRMKDFNYIEELKLQLQDARQQALATQAQLREKTIESNAERACKEIIQEYLNSKTV